jgi:dTDP-4-amino-4,6-dideoxygalactose transaminase
MSNITPAPWPHFSEAEGELVQQILLSNKVNYWTGERGREFESAFANATESEFAIALANGTVALELALKCAGLGPGDEVVVTPRSFMASASSIESVDARPVFADVDLDSQNITAETIEAVLTDKTRAVICVHLAGWPCEMDSIMALAKQRNLFVIEDCAQAHGAKYKGRSVGSMGDIGAWSFCQDKIMTTGGEGGMITTNNPDLFESMWSYKDHGKNRQKMENPPQNRQFKFVHDNFGTNLRLTEMQAGLGLYQLGLLDDWNTDRNDNANVYSKGLSRLDGLVRTTLPPEHIHHAYYKYYFFINEHSLRSGWTRDRIVEEVNDKGGACASGSCPEIYLEQAFTKKYGEHKRLRNAVMLGKESVMLMCHPGLSSDFLEYNLEVISDVLTTAKR